jgi:hypothetical protein
LKIIFLVQEICLELSYFEINSSPYGSTPNQVGYLHYIDSWNKILNEFKLWNFAVKYDLDKHLVARFIKPTDWTIWLSPIIVVRKKNGELKICIDFQKLALSTKKDPYPLLFTIKVLDVITSHEIYSFLDGILSYHQSMTTLKDKYKTIFYH